MVRVRFGVRARVSVRVRVRVGVRGACQLCREGKRGLPVALQLARITSNDGVRVVRRGTRERRG